MKGKVLSNEVVQVFNEFTEAISIFSQRTYDSLNPLDKVSYLYQFGKYSICSGPFSCIWFLCVYKFMSLQLKIS